MAMDFENRIRKYEELNKLSNNAQTVIFGGAHDLEIPLCEIKQYFDIDMTLYNRSLGGLSVRDSVEIYDRCVASLMPEKVILHLGEADNEYFSENQSGFDADYNALIAHIKSLDKNCDILLVSIKNAENDRTVKAMNSHIKSLAAANGCDFADITDAVVKNPEQMRQAIQFVHTLGFFQPVKQSLPSYDLVKILYNYDNIGAPVGA